MSILLPALPVLFLKSHKHSSILFIPPFVLNIITQGTGNSSILFASSIAVTAVLIYISVLTVSENQVNQTVPSSNGTRHLLLLRAAIVSIVCALLFNSAYTQYRIGDSVNIIAEHGEQNKAIIDVIEQIPDNAAVSASKPVSNGRTATAGWFRNGTSTTGKSDARTPLFSGSTHPAN